MREIKFRAWIRDDEWDESEEQQEYVMVYDLAFEEYEPLNDLLASVKHLMQFTGLHDKNGKEIYEEDIWIHPDFNKPQVIKDMREFYMEIMSRNINCNYVEVVGNVYEIRELLKEANDEQ